MARPANIPVAKTIAPSDNSTSVVIDGSGQQVEVGKTPLMTYQDIVYDGSASSAKALKLDLQMPRTSGEKPLVVYITGGGFVLADKSSNLTQRTYVAEQGYVVASIEYRTVNNGATYNEAVADVKSAIDYYAGAPASTRSTKARSRYGGSPRVATSRR